MMPRRITVVGVPGPLRSLDPIVTCDVFARHCYGPVTPHAGFHPHLPDWLNLMHSGVDRNDDSLDDAAIDADEIQMQIRALTDASLQRQRLVRGTWEYDSALETEERLASYVWSLVTPPAKLPASATETEGRHKEP